VADLAGWPAGGCDKRANLNSKGYLGLRGVFATSKMEGAGGNEKEIKKGAGSLEQKKT